MPTLIIAEHDNQALKPATLNTISAGISLSDAVHVAILGQGTGPITQAAAQIAGVAQIIQIDAEPLRDHLAENLTPAIVALVKGGGYTHVLFPATSFGKNLAPRVAALLDVQQISDVIAIESPDTFRRPIYAGNAIATMQSTDAIKVMTVRATAFSPAPATGGAATVQNGNVEVGNTGQSTLLARDHVVSARPELTAARIVISGGRGLGSAENFKLIEQLADKLGAAVGASRAAVDAGYVANECQVGQTGKIVAPDLYIAIGISGAIQHLAGMKESKVIVAINKDADAPIFQIADYGLVADLFTAVPELVEKL